jgi:hypothetical protein
LVVCAFVSSFWDYVPCTLLDDAQLRAWYHYTLCGRAHGCMYFLLLRPFALVF